MENTSWEGESLSLGAYLMLRSHNMLLIETYLFDLCLSHECQGTCLPRVHKNVQQLIRGNGQRWRANQCCQRSWRRLKCVTSKSQSLLCAYGISRKSARFMNSCYWDGITEKPPTLWLFYYEIWIRGESDVAKEHAKCRWGCLLQSCKNDQNFRYMEVWGWAHQME